MSTEEKVDSKAKVPETHDEEEDLDDLDDLLDDFAGEVLSKPPGAGAKAGTSTQGSSVAGGAAADNKESSNKHETGEGSSSQNAQSDIKDGPVNEEFKDKLEELIKDLNIQDPETKDQFHQLVQNFEDQYDNKFTKDPKSFDNIMQDTMERLKNSGKTIDEQIKNDQSGANPEDLLSQLLSSFGNTEDGKDFDMSKLLVDMLEQLSSKGILYDPIKDLNTKFPDYLSENKTTLSTEEYDNFSKQYEITNDIVAVFESEGYSDDDSAQREKVNSLLESLQELGQPPKDLVGDTGDFPYPGYGGTAGMDFSNQDLPQDFDKELEEGCKQQ